MAHIENFEVRPKRVSAIDVAQEISRIKYMLVATMIGAMIIVVVAALFMTMMV